MPEDLQLFVQRVERDGERITELETAIRMFLAELDETVAALMKVAP